MTRFPIRCGRCLNSSGFRRSRVRFYDWIPWALFLRPYRCKNCYRRVYIWTLPGG